MTLNNAYRQLKKTAEEKGEELRYRDLIEYIPLKCQSSPIDELRCADCNDPCVIEVMRLLNLSAPVVCVS